MDFITVDFETADYERDTPCEIGFTFVENSRIVKSKSWLIKPYCWPDFDFFNVSIHGITPEMVEDAPTWEELWPTIDNIISGKFLIAHNAGFDFSVMRHTLDYYDLPYPEFDYACSYIFSKHAWPGMGSYSLDNLCANHGIIRRFHRAEEDSIATAHLALLAFEDSEVTSIDQLSEKLRTITGQLKLDGYKPCLTKRIYGPGIDLAQFKGDPEKLNPDNVFYGKKVVFTGTLSSMQRKDAFQKVVDVGGIISDRLTKDVNFLIVGQQNYKVVGDSGMSSKQKTALKYANSGLDIEVVSEDFFLENL